MKNNTSNPNKDLQTIREIMERSSRFLSLSGLSGISAGITAIAGAVIAWVLLSKSDSFRLNPATDNLWIFSTPETRTTLAILAALVFLFAVLGAFYFSHRKARKAGQRFWTGQTHRLLIHLLIPLASGAIFCLLLHFRQQWDLIPSVMLIFYGLSLVNAGKFTFGEIHYLGLTEIVLGIAAGFFIGWAPLLWIAGFGLMHIIYGIIMYFRYEKK